MTEATGPERVRSAEQIELSVREAAAGVAPRNDAGRWAAKVDRLDVVQRDGVRGTNVACRRLTGPVQGFGKMWQKTYRLTVGTAVTPEQAITTWKAHFPEFWPAWNRFAGALTGISPGDVALLDLAIGGGVKLSTGVFVLYADEESFTLMTPQGHMFAGWITFSAEGGPDGTAVQAQVLMRANDPLYELGMMFGGHRKEDVFWAETLTALGRYLGRPRPGRIHPHRVRGQQPAVAQRQQCLAQLHGAQHAADPGRPGHGPAPAPRLTRPASRGDKDVWYRQCTVTLTPWSWAAGRTAWRPRSRSAPPACASWSSKAARRSAGAAGPRNSPCRDSGTTSARPPIRWPWPPRSSAVSTSPHAVSGSPAL